jgi:hypothetical protein
LTGEAIITGNRKGEIGHAGGVPISGYDGRILRQFGTLILNSLRGKHPNGAPVAD